MLIISLFPGLGCLPREDGLVKTPVPPPPPRQTVPVDRSKCWLRGRPRVSTENPVFLRGGKDKGAFSRPGFPFLGPLQLGGGQL